MKERPMLSLSARREKLAHKEDKQLIREKLLVCCAVWKEFILGQGLRRRPCTGEAQRVLGRWHYNGRHTQGTGRVAPDVHVNFGWAARGRVGFTGGSIILCSVLGGEGTGPLLPTQSGYEPKASLKNNVYVEKKKKNPPHQKTALGVYGITAFGDFKNKGCYFQLDFVL